MTIRGTYGFLVHNLFPLFTTMAIGCVLAAMYMGVYCKYTTQPMRIAKILSFATAFLMLVMTYVAMGLTGKTGQTTDEVATVIGYVGSIVSFLLYSSPFEKIVQVLRTRSAACIPIGLCVASAIGNSLWTISGALNFDLFVLLPNAVCSVPPMIQVVLYLVFRPKKQSAILLLNQHGPASPQEARAAPKTPPALPNDHESDLAYQEVATPHSDTVILVD